jgi:hypothetical protein
MCRPHTTLYTKTQTEMLFRSWQCTEPIPGKGKKVCIGFAGQEIDLIEVAWTDRRSDYGDRLYAVTASSAWGRVLEQTICEAHVLLWRNIVRVRTREEKRKQLNSADALEQVQLLECSEA